MPLLTAPCPRCGRDAPSAIRPGPSLPRLAEATVRCASCGSGVVPGSALRLAP
jgi:endogenous inhibitor of DNA gyrase (YacG/DUF329 family)